MSKKKKIRVDLRKNRSKPARERGWTRSFQEHGGEDDQGRSKESVRPKGDMSRRRTIIQDDTAGTPGGAESAEMPAVDISACLQGRVLRVHGLFSDVATDDPRLTVPSPPAAGGEGKGEGGGRVFRCSVRRLLRTLAIDERNVVTTGDRVWFRPAPNNEGLIERVEPRHGLLTRASRARQHVIVANVDQVVIVMSLVEPDIKPHLIDRYLVSAAKGGIAPIICLNKADLVDHAPVQPLIGLYSQLGTPAFLTSAVSGLGIDRLRKYLHNRETVFAGQSGVGKSSLLNTIQPDLALQVREVSEATQKGKHTTTTAELIRLNLGGWVVDTPGIRQFELWDIIPEEVEGFFPEFRPFVPLCGYPDCTHTHEDRCAIKRAVKRRQISEQRYISYLGLFAGERYEA
jgi:ribosome biogenesis GTPase